MKRDLLKILILFLLAFSACRRSESSDGSDGFKIFSSDQTPEAGEKVREINENELKKIKTIYRDSDDQVEELKAAIKNKEVDKVKKLATELAGRINEGITLGNEAVSKLEEIQKMEINETYRDYLNKKEQALSKQIDAFSIRFEETRYLREEFQVDDKKEIDRSKDVLEDMEEKFKKKMDAAHDLSQEANLIAKESLKKSADQ